MSKKLLEFLNGNKNGHLKKFIDSIDDKVNIVWYPSAGIDFRGLAYLSKKYNEMYPVEKQINIYPDIFIFTDYYPWRGSGFPFKHEIYSDKKTKVFYNKYEELPKLYLPLDNEIVTFPESTKVLGKVIYIEVSVKVRDQYEFKYPVIYVAAENESFCSKVLLKYQAEITHIIHIRYGHGFGGGRASGGWIPNVMQRLKTKLYINDGHSGENKADKIAKELYPNLKESEKKPVFETIRIIPGIKWSNHGDVRWDYVIGHTNINVSSPFG